MKKREIKLRAIESNGFDGEVPLKPLAAVGKNTTFLNFTYTLTYTLFPF